MSRWRIVFMGTPDFSVSALQALLDGPDEVVGVFVQPDKPAGRGMKMIAPPVKQLAEKAGIPVFQPGRIRGNAEAAAQLAALQPDLGVVVAYGQILPREFLFTPTHGCVNIHASYLPRWRGAAPIHRAILAGDEATGISIIQMDEGLDTGALLLQRPLPLPPEATGGWLHDQLAALGARMILETVAGLKAGPLHPTPQAEEGVTYAKKIAPGEELLDWTLQAEILHRQIRAFDPWPGAQTLLNGQVMKIFAPRILPGSGTPGQVVAIRGDGFVVACGVGSLLVSEVQLAGKKRMLAADWLRGRGVAVGMKLGE